MPGPELAWRQIFWPRPLDPEVAVSLLRAWASDQRSPTLVLEVHATGHPAGGQVAYWLGAAPAVIEGAVATLRDLIPGTFVVVPAAVARPTRPTVRRLKATTRHRALDASRAEPASRAVLSALHRVRDGEQLLLQAVLGPRRVPLAIPNTSPSSIVAPWWEIAWRGNGQQVDGEKRRALREKVELHGYACTVRLAVTAATPRRRQLLLLGLMAALRSSETPGLQLRLHRESSTAVTTAAKPWRWPLRLNAAELLCLLGWPLGDGDLPGLPAPHPKQLPPAAPAAAGARVLATATAPGPVAVLGLTARDALQHLHVVGPTGVGKSTLLANVITQDIAAGRAVVVIEPRGDLIEDVLAHVPERRQADVVVLDVGDRSPVGLNPLATAGRSPEVVADGILSVFKALYAEAWGPRTQDILHASLLTLARRPDASLVMLPLLLTNPGFRRSLITNLRDPIALGPFWAWYEDLSDGERQQAIAPVMNKLRQWLLRPSLRAVLGQREPLVSLRQVFTERKILLVPLRKGLVGPEAAALLGSLVVAELWQATLERAGIPAAKRHPVMVYVDEVQDYLHLPTDLGDALAQARGLGVGFTLAHQFLGQLRPEMRAGVLANARSRVCFQLAHDDASVMAKGHPELSPDDLTALGQYEIYASLFQGGAVTPYASGKTSAPSPAISDPTALRELSCERYGRPLDEIEAGFADLITGPDRPSTTAPTGRRRRPS